MWPWGTIAALKRRNDILTAELMDTANRNTGLQQQVNAQAETIRRKLDEIERLASELGVANVKILGQNGEIERLTAKLAEANEGWAKDRVALIQAAKNDARDAATGKYVRGATAAEAAADAIPGRKSKTAEPAAELDVPIVPLVSKAPRKRKPT